MWGDTIRDGQAASFAAPMLPRSLKVVRKTNLTDRFIKSRRPAPPGRRDLYYDAIVPALRCE